MGCNTSKPIYNENTGNEINNQNTGNKINNQKEKFCKIFSISEQKYDILKNQYSEEDLKDFVNNGGNFDEDTHDVIHNIYTWTKIKN